MKTMRKIRSLSYLARLILGWGLLLAGQHTRAQRAEPLPPALEGVGIAEHLETELPLDLAFTDEEGRRVALREYFAGQRPVILTLNY